jgi:hypothetical protein
VNLAFRLAPLHAGSQLLVGLRGMLRFGTVRSAGRGPPESDDDQRFRWSSGGVEVRDLNPWLPPCEYVAAHRCADRCSRRWP